MNTQDIIKQLNNLHIKNSEDYDNLDIVEELTTYLRKNTDGYLACEAMIDLLERHPNVEFGTPGEPVHTLETFQGHYEDFLLQSLEKCPTEMTLWMLNRIINALPQDQKDGYLQILKHCINHPQADQLAKESAKHFYEYQIKNEKHKTSIS